MFIHKEQIPTTPSCGTIELPFKTIEEVRENLMYLAIQSNKAEENKAYLWFNADDIKRAARDVYGIVAIETEKNMEGQLKPEEYIGTLLLNDDNNTELHYFLMKTEDMMKFILQGEERP